MTDRDLETDGQIPNKTTETTPLLVPDENQALSKPKVQYEATVVATSSQSDDSSSAEEDVVEPPPFRSSSVIGIISLLLIGISAPVTFSHFKDTLTLAVTLKVFSCPTPMEVLSWLPTEPFPLNLGLLTMQAGLRRAMPYLPRRCNLWPAS